MMIVEAVIVLDDCLPTTVAVFPMTVLSIVLSATPEMVVLLA